MIEGSTGLIAHIGFPTHAFKAPMGMNDRDPMVMDVARIAPKAFVDGFVFCNRGLLQ